MKNKTTKQQIELAFKNVDTLWKDKEFNQTKLINLLEQYDAKNLKSIIC